MDPIHSTSPSLPPQNIATPSRSTPKETIQEIAISNNKTEKLQGHFSKSKLPSSDQAKKNLPSENFFTRVLEFVKSTFKAIFQTDSKKMVTKSDEEKWKEFDRQLADLNTQIEEAVKKYQDLSSTVAQNYDHPDNQLVGQAMNRLEKLNKQRDDLMKTGITNIK